MLHHLSHLLLVKCFGIVQGSTMIAYQDYPISLSDVLASNQVHHLLTLQVAIKLVHDVAQALMYLRSASPPILLEFLSPDSILLDASMQARLLVLPKAATSGQPYIFFYRLLSTY